MRVHFSTWIEDERYSEYEYEVDAIVDPPDPSVGVGWAVAIESVRSPSCRGEPGCRGNRNRVDELDEKQIARLEEIALDVAMSAEEDAREAEADYRSERAREERMFGEET